MQAGGRFGMQTMDQSLADAREGGQGHQQMAYERCHDPEELNGSSAAAAGSAPAGSRRPGSRSGTSGSGRPIDADTYDYKVRDRTGNVVTGQLVADSERSSCSKLREMGMTPVEVEEAHGRPEDGDQPPSRPSEAEGARGVLAASSPPW